MILRIGQFKYHTLPVTPFKHRSLFKKSLHIKEGGGGDCNIAAFSHFFSYKLLKGTDVNRVFHSTNGWTHEITFADP